MSASQLLKTAVHQDRLMSREGMLQRLFSRWFNGFVYNQIWEDPKVDLQALELKADSQLLTIASGGCNILNYLVEKPKRLVAVDLNPYHMYLTRLKLAALKHLPDHDSFYHFFGYADQKGNLDHYKRYISAHLDEETRHFWEKSLWPKRPRIRYFGKNVYQYARFGYFMRFLHKIAKAAGAQPERLLQAKTLEEQEEIFRKESDPFFDNWLVNKIGNMPFAVFSLGIPPQQYNAMREQSHGNLINLYRERVRHLACDFPIQDNYFAWQGFGLRYDHEKRQAIPDYLRQEHYETLKANLHRVETYITSLIDFLEAQPRYSLDRFVFLDAQDWMKDAVLTRLWKAIARVGRPGSRIIFRTASSESPIETALPTELRARFVYEKERSQALYQQDRSAIYGGFHIYHIAEA
jgi:S-adenosylmethionine-diacylglycerol 3-amino-3-carboxypropyl transferase